MLLNYEVFLLSASPGIAVDGGHQAQSPTSLWAPPAPLSQAQAESCLGGAVGEGSRQGWQRLNAVGSQADSYQASHYSRSAALTLGPATGD